MIPGIHMNVGALGAIGGEWEIHYNGITNTVPADIAANDVCFVMRTAGAVSTVSSALGYAAAITLAAGWTRLVFDKDTSVAEEGKDSLLTWRSGIGATDYKKLVLGDASTVLSSTGILVVMRKTMSASSDSLLLIDSSIAGNINGTVSFSNGIRSGMAITAWAVGQSTAGASTYDGVDPLVDEQRGVSTNAGVMIAHQHNPTDVTVVAGGATGTYTTGYFS